MPSRRQFIAISPASIAAGLDTRSRTPLQAPTTGEDTLRSEFLLDLTLQTQTRTTVGFLGGDRVIVTVAGGSFQGPGLKGTIAAGGGDWIVQRPDGSRVLDVRLVMLTDDAKKIFVTWRGLAYTDGGTLFARIVPLFETNSEKYAWLNRVVSVGVYRPAAGPVTYRLYRIL
jgi:uncharacterized protein DUF3237